MCKIKWRFGRILGIMEKTKNGFVGFGFAQNMDRLIKRCVNTGIMSLF